MASIQVNIDDYLLSELRKAGDLAGQDITQVIREALEAWLRRWKGTQFEQEWITALMENPDETNRDSGS